MFLAPFQVAVLLLLVELVLCEHCHEMTFVDLDRDGKAFVGVPFVGVVPFGRVPLGAVVAEKLS